MTVCSSRTVPLTDAQVAELDPESWVPCCYGSAFAVEDGPEAVVRSCTCWTPVYDLDQTDPVPGPPRTRTVQCSDCAYLASTGRDPDRYPEQRERERLFELGPDEPFYCHDGMRRIIAWEHPAGHRIVPAEDNYSPPVRGTTAYRADGTPADRCAGWARLAESRR